MTTIAFSRAFLVTALVVCGSQARAQSAPEQPKPLPPPANRTVDFAKDVQPILLASCVRCHARGKSRGGLSIETRDALLEGGDTGRVVVPGKSEESLLIALVSGRDPDLVMPQKGSRLKPDQIGILRAWIDQGLTWDSSVTFAKSEPRNLHPRRPDLLMPSHGAHPVDELLKPYYASHGVTPGPAADDRTLVRRMYLDVIGIPPTPEEVQDFAADTRPDKRTRLVQTLLADRVRYAEHWLSFWNDLLRNDYRGTGYIDGGRQQISAWLYDALISNLPYDRFVAQLVDPVPGSEGFSKGIVWRGVVNASQTPQMQAAQNISQVFMGVNLKCASCHDSFINDWQLTDSYGMAGIYAEGPLEMVECDRPLGRNAPVKFLYPQLGTVDASLSRAERLKRLAAILTGPQNGRLSRTLVNRIWARFMGRGLVDQVDDMEREAWHADLLDWLAEDFVTSGYDVKKTIERILTSQAYQQAAVDLPEQAEPYVFRGPAIRRISAEQFVDMLSAVTGVWQTEPAGDFDFTATGSPPLRLSARWIWPPSSSARAGEADVIYFRKTFRLARMPASARVLVGYDRSYTVFINGQKVGEQKQAGRPRLIDIGPYVRQGSNLLAIAATNGPATRPDGSPAARRTSPYGLLAQVLIRVSDGAAVPVTVTAGSDRTWLWSARETPAWERPELRPTGWRPALERKASPPPRVTETLVRVAAAAGKPGPPRTSLGVADPLTTALGRPNREQVLTTRLAAPTTLQALELLNGETLAALVKKGAQRLLADEPPVGVVIDRVYRRALGRAPSPPEVDASRALLGEKAGPAGVEDLLWAVAMLPEFQLIY
jgi:Protein of unknown function (DUF1549)/Protein of unknown function (DUF1553)/Planctomycete cytochrome C